MQTCYDVLEVPPEAAQDEVHAQYRALAFLYHPDRYAHAPERVRTLAQRKMTEINDAWHALSTGWRKRPPAAALAPLTARPSPLAATPDAVAEPVLAPAPSRSGPAFLIVAMVAGCLTAWALLAHLALGAAHQVAPEGFWVRIPNHARHETSPASAHRMHPAAGRSHPGRHGANARHHHGGGDHRPR